MNCFRLPDFIKTIGLLVLLNLYALPAECREIALASAKDITELSIEELMSITITSVSKKKEKLFESAAAVYVISQEDIRRSGFKSIPEALRMVPGIQVAHVDANTWAISARGFNDLFSDKLLVMVDGRSVYTPAYSGVYWDAQDTLMEDIDRIEVVRGPGGTLWGANAVNGVINIITKNAKDTQGGIMTAGGGTEETGFGSVRYGGKLGETSHYRTYAKHKAHTTFAEEVGNEGADEGNTTQAGFRIDWDFSENSALTVQGDGYYGESGQRVNGVVAPASPFTKTVDDDAQLSGANILTRWRRTLSEKSDLELKLYYDRTSRQEFFLGQTIDTIDIDFQHRLPVTDRQELTWGFGERIVSDHFDNTFATSLNPTSQINSTTSVFAQDAITLIEDRLRLTIGSKFEWNTFTGVEAQPSLRMLWTPHENHSVWGAVSRAVRVPARTDDAFRLNFSAFQAGPNTTVLQLRGNDALGSEELTAFELGYRVKPVERLSFDIATFLNLYDNLVTSESIGSFTATEPSPAHTISPKQPQNQMYGETYGVELATTWNALDFWTLKAGFTWLQMHLHLNPSSNSTTAEAEEDNVPTYQFNIRSLLSLPHNLELDTALFYVDEVKKQSAEDYVRLDVRLGWNPRKDLEVSLALQNLLDPQHPEFGNQGAVIATEVPRGAYGQVLWRF